MHNLMSGLSGNAGTKSKNKAHGIVEPKAIIQIPTMISRARFLVICNFNGHQIAKNLQR